MYPFGFGLIKDICGWKSMTMGKGSISLNLLIATVLRICIAALINGKAPSILFQKKEKEHPPN